jgi:hypothetical protein
MESKIMESKIMESKIIKIKRYDPEMVKAHPNHLFIFGCNCLKKGTGGQAIIRYCQNAYGIPTKKLPSQMPNSYFSDNDYESNTQKIKEAIDNIPSNYEYIVFPEDGLGTGLAQLPTRAPRTYKFLVDYLNSKFENIYE